MHDNRTSSSAATLDQYDIKAARIHGEPRLPIGTPVRVMAIDVSFGTVFRLALFFLIAQAIIAGAILGILFVAGAI